MGFKSNSNLFLPKKTDSQRVLYINPEINDVYSRKFAFMPSQKSEVNIYTQSFESRLLGHNSTPQQNSLRKMTDQAYAERNYSPFYSSTHSQISENLNSMKAMQQYLNRGGSNARK